MNYVITVLYHVVSIHTFTLISIQSIIFFLKYHSIALYCYGLHWWDYVLDVLWTVCMYIPHIFIYILLWLFFSFWPFFARLLFRTLGCLCWREYRILYPVVVVDCDSPFGSRSLGLDHGRCFCCDGLARVMRSTPRFGDGAHDVADSISGSHPRPRSVMLSVRS